MAAYMAITDASGRKSKLIVSSYGTLSDGRELPHLRSGAAIISSTNSYFVENAENNVEEADIRRLLPRVPNATSELLAAGCRNFNVDAVWQRVPSLCSPKLKILI